MTRAPAVRCLRRRGVAGLAALVASLGVVATGASTPPPVVAPAYVVVGSVDGAVLAQRASGAKRPIASITKLMTVLVALEHARPGESVVVPAAATRVGESSILLRAGERLTVRELAMAALIPSANDAATALAFHVGHGSIGRFVQLMNAKARALGMHDTHFVNPHGLDAAGHVSSARDVVTLLETALRRPFIRRAVTTTTATISGARTLETTDRLIDRIPGFLGGKTGHTNGAGWSQVAAVRGPGVVVYASVLGDATEAQRDDDLATLLRYGLASYDRLVVVSPERVYAEARTGWGRPPVRLVAPKRIVRAVRVGRPLVERVVVPTAVELPIARGAPLGEVRVFDGARLVAAAPLVAADAVARPGVAGRAGYYAKRTIHHLIGLVD